MREAAKRLGYQPDAALSALCAYQTQKRPVQQHAVLAWLTNYSVENRWKASPYNCDTLPVPSSAQRSAAIASSLFGWPRRA